MSLNFLITRKIHIVHDHYWVIDISSSFTNMCFHKVHFQKNLSSYAVYGLNKVLSQNAGEDLSCHHPELSEYIVL